MTSNICTKHSRAFTQMYVPGRGYVMACYACVNPQPETSNVIYDTTTAFTPPEYTPMDTSVAYDPPSTSYDPPSTPDTSTSTDFGGGGGFSGGGGGSDF